MLLRSLLEGRCGLGAVYLRLIPHICPWVGSEEEAGVCWIIPSGRRLKILSERGRNKGLRETLSLVLVLSFKTVVKREAGVVRTQKKKKKKKKERKKGRKEKKKK